MSTLPRPTVRQQHGRCKHFNGLSNKCCRAGIDYGTVRVVDDPPPGASFPCIPHMNTMGATCDKAEFPTEAEIDAAIERGERALRLIAENKSPCCEAEIDCRRVIPAGRHKGHGPRFCSRCGKLVFMV